ncbi:MAG TPA: cytosine permease [Acidimicrobiales bacterium]
MTIAGEPPLTLDQAPARSLGLGDQLALWANLGVSLLLPVTATFLLAPGMSLLAALTAVLVGTIIGNVLLGLSAVPGAETGAPAMVLMRGLFGRRGSYAPTVVNLVQCLGWSVFEIVIMAETANRVVGGGWRWQFVLIAGAISTLMAIRPLAVVHILKRYAVWVVLASTLYLFVEVFRQPLPGLTDGDWNGFWPAADLVAALAVSWMPLAADYTRQAKDARTAFWGASIGYAVASAAFFVLGILALSGLRVEPGFDVIDAIIAIPAGGLALVILVFDEIDEGFANIYSTAVSAQNLVPRVDRRLLAAGIGTVATLLALLLNIVAYQDFLFLIGSVFVPLFAVFIVDYYVIQRRRWDITESAPDRPLLLIPWIVGFVAYQLVNPGTVGWWADWWMARRTDLHLDPPAWLSASLVAFVVASLLTFAVSRPRHATDDGTELARATTGA